MLTLGADLTVYLHREPIDFRVGINSLAVLVQETMALDPFAPAVCAFCNRRRDRVKLLFFDRSGFVLILKRLTEDKFRWPRQEVPVVTLTSEQLHWILDAIDIDAAIERWVPDCRNDIHAKYLLIFYRDYFSEFLASMSVGELQTREDVVPADLPEIHRTKEGEA